MTARILEALAALWLAWWLTVSLWAPRHPRLVPGPVKRLRRRLYCRRHQHAAWTRGADGDLTLTTCWGCEHLTPPPPPTWRPGSVRPVKATVFGFSDLTARINLRMAFVMNGDDLADLLIDRDVDFGIIPDATHIAYADDQRQDLIYVELVREIKIFPLTLGGHA